MPGQRSSNGFVGMVCFSCCLKRGPEISDQAHNYISRGESRNRGNKR